MTQDLEDVPVRLRATLLHIIGACRSDLRFRAVWLQGSLARGLGDDWSDIDLHVAVEDVQDFDAVEWLASLLPLVLADAIPGLPGAFICLTPEWVHIDLNVHALTDELPGRLPRRVLLDRTASVSDVPEAGRPAGRAFFPGQQAQIFLHFMGKAVAAVHRADWIALSDTTVAMRDSLLIPLMLAENGIRADPGEKRIARHLNEEQKDSLQRLPAIGLTERDLREAQQALAVEYLTRARRLADVCGAVWPAELEQAAKQLWLRELGIHLPDRS